MTSGLDRRPHTHDFHDHLHAMFTLRSPPGSRRYLAELLAGRAKCYLQKRDFDAANVQAEAALAIHGGCGDAFVVRGQVRS